MVDANPIIEEGYVRGVYIQLKDVTEKYELEQHVIISDRFSAIGKLAAGLAHEIRNPLTSVMGFMQILKNSGDYSKAESYMPIMYGELQRVKQLVSDFVLASKPSAPLTSETNLHHLLDETVMFMESQALLKGVELSKEYNIPQNVMLHIDAAQIKQVLINTIQNAIEATESSGGHVTLGCHVNAKKNMCVISIEDTGVGMDEEELNQITTPFFTTKETGTGLGMAVTYRIIENHGGKIRINSKKGVGTRVDIILPY